MNPDLELSTLDLRHYLRRLRNLLVALVMFGAFIQAFGIPRVDLTADAPSIRLEPTKHPVWDYALNALTFVWSRIAQEIHP